VKHAWSDQRCEGVRWEKACYLSCWAAHLLSYFVTMSYHTKPWTHLLSLLIVIIIMGRYFYPHNPCKDTILASNFSIWLYQFSIAIKQIIKNLAPNTNVLSHSSHGTETWMWVSGVLCSTLKLRWGCNLNGGSGYNSKPMVASRIHFLVAIGWKPLVLSGYRNHSLLCGHFHNMAFCHLSLQLQ
jgi:hypothetical protein